MRQVARIPEVRDALAAARREGRRIGLVPTMGAFHAGHLSLMERARAECEVVVVSLFVNPSQFDEPADLDAYPRDLERDRRLAERAGVDVLFAPSTAEMYPPGFATTVSVAGLGDRLEGEHRGAAHFAAVATVVTKLLNIVGPDVAYFGQKDAQQAAVIRRVVADLDLPVRIEVLPTVREPDGLAHSSRNVRLSAEERRRASALHRALQAVAGAVAAGERRPQAALAHGLAQLSAAGIEPEYLELVDAETFTPLGALTGDAVAVLAARVGGTRLIDNQPITSNGRRQ